jgi:hypothetical protein
VVARTGGRPLAPSVEIIKAVILFFSFSVMNWAVLNLHFETPNEIVAVMAAQPFSTLMKCTSPPANSETDSNDCILG